MVTANPPFVYTYVTCVIVNIVFSIIIGNNPNYKAHRLQTYSQHDPYSLLHNARRTRNRGYDGGSGSLTDNLKHASATYWSISRQRPRNFLCTSRERRSVPGNRQIANGAFKTSAVRGDATSGVGNCRVYIRVWFSAWTERLGIDESWWRIKMTERTSCQHFTCV